MRRGHPIDHLTDCGKCKMQFDSTTRAAMGCGYEKPRDGARPWSPKNFNGKWIGTELACPGYTTNLPEVIETARGRIHWNKSSLRDFCGGEQPTDETLACIELLESSCNEMIAWSQDNPETK